MKCNIENAVKRIKDYVLNSGVKRYRIACEAGVSEKSLRDVLSDDWNPRLSTLIKLDASVPYKYRRE